MSLIGMYVQITAERLLKMDISKIQQKQIRDYNLEQVRLQEKRDEDFRKVVEKRRFDQIIAERVSRNLRLDLDKGRQIDIEC
jgi:uncharacterized membrane protein